MVFGVVGVGPSGQPAQGVGFRRAAGARPGVGVAFHHLAVAGHLGEPADVVVDVGVVVAHPGHGLGAAGDVAGRVPGQAV